jgi:hypothetical protein
VQISITPFNYVEKRETVQNVEVFSDGIKEIAKLIGG